MTVILIADDTHVGHYTIIIIQYYSYYHNTACLYNIACCCMFQMLGTTARNLTSLLLLLVYVSQLISAFSVKPYEPAAYYDDDDAAAVDASDAPLLLSIRPGLKRSRSFLVAQPWLRGPSMRYRHALSGSTGYTANGLGEYQQAAAYPGQQQPQQLQQNEETQRQQAKASALTSGPPPAMLRTSHTQVPSLLSSAAAASSPQDVEQQECRKVCRMCRQVLSIRVAALCLTECRLGGKSYDACYTVWSIRDIVMQA